MYIPEYHRVEDPQVSLAFIRTNPFAILISDLNQVPFATHLPLLAKETPGGLILQGHVAKANPHWTAFEQDGEVLAIFHGPHAYVSPELYETEESVPTWNYAAVHVYGRGRICHDNGRITDILQALISAFDPSYAARWTSLSNEYRERMTRHIVAFEIAVTRVETKFKLSQNRTTTEQENIIQSLASSADSAASAVAGLMRGQGLGIR